MMKSVLKLSFASLAVLAAGASGCLSRDVSPNEPTTKVNVNSRLKQQAVDKIDLLLAIDNSSSMGDKQTFLAQAVPRLVTRLVTPTCVATDGTVGKPSTLNALGEGECNEDGADFKPEFKPITDIHIGVVSSSLGNFGNTGTDAVCSDGEGKTANDHAELVNRAPSVQSENGNFLAWFPDVQKNDGKTKPSAGFTDSDSLNAAFSTLVEKVGENGCGLEAQLESVYQFLIAPQPWKDITVTDNKAGYSGINTTVLKQRHDFLRPDSLVAVIMLTDEDDSSVDPLSVGGTGYYYMSYNFPGGIDRGGTTTAAKGTPICETDPGSPDCTSCAFGGCGDQTASYYAADDDDINVRFHDMKRRYGVDPQYPIQRYTNGLSSNVVASRDKENHDGQPDVNKDCVNPLFYGGELPTDGNDTDTGLAALCKLPATSAESRDPNLVFFALVGGIPNELIDKESGARDEDNNLTADAWTKILGADPLAYNFEGKDPRMVQSTEPRAGRPGPTEPDAPADDPLNKGHRDWKTNKLDLQYACTFPIPTALQQEVSAKSAKGDCKIDSDAPLCEAGPKNVVRKQIRAKAYPTIREALVVRQLGSQGILGSLCPKVVVNENDPNYGYNPAVNEIVDRLKNALTQTCLPQALSKDDNGNVPCLMLEVMPEEVKSCGGIEGRTDPEPTVIAKFREGLDANQKSRTVCALGQNPGAKSADECQRGTGDKAGWCYLDGANAGRCSQQVVFNDRLLSLAKGSTVYLQCISQYSPKTETSSSGGGDGK